MSLWLPGWQASAHIYAETSTKALASECCGTHCCTAALTGLGRSGQSAVCAESPRAVPMGLSVRC